MSQLTDKIDWAIKKAKDAAAEEPPDTETIRAMWGYIAKIYPHPTGRPRVPAWAREELPTLKGE